MSRAHNAENAADREADQLLRDFNEGLITREDYNAAMRELQRDVRDAYEMDREDALREVDNEWGRW
jgi:predicted RNA-binding protein associated with RNAse of E/G family